MPNVEISLAQGRTEQQIRELISAVHEAVLRTAATRPEHIRVLVREIPQTHWTTGNQTIAETRAGRSKEQS
jgi:4-oxalocrotonate tautomerase